MEKSGVYGWNGDLGGLRARRYSDDHKDQSTVSGHTKRWKSGEQETVKGTSPTLTVAQRRDRERSQWYTTTNEASTADTGRRRRSLSGTSSTAFETLTASSRTAGNEKSTIRQPCRRVAGLDAVHTCSLLPKCPRFARWRLKRARRER